MNHRFDYIVCRKTPGRIFSRILLFVFVFVFSGVLWLDHTFPMTESPITRGFLYTVPIIMILTALLNLHLETRPCIKVSGDTLILLPRWKRAKTIQASQITSREIRFSSPTYTLQEGYITSYTEINYYKGNEKLITIHSYMENADRLDQRVKQLLHPDE